MPTPPHRRPLSLLGPGDDEYEASAADLEHRFGQVKAAVQQSVRQIDSAHDLLRTTYAEMDGDIKRFGANGVSTATVVN